jgi:ribokinase
MHEPKIIVMGSFVADLMGRGKDIPAHGQTLKGDFFKIGPGGKGANQAVAAARAGGHVAMITKLGRDSFGDMALANFKSEGIDTDHVLVSDEDPTGVALILVSERTGQNSIMVIPGACGKMGSGEVDAAMRALAPADVLMLQLETNMEAFEASLRAGRELGMRVICNPAPAQPIPEALYPLIDFLTPNETEAAALAGTAIESIADAEKAACILLERGVGHVVVTLGVQGVLSLGRDGAARLVSSYGVEAVDTTGAGDAFNGAFAFALAEGRDVESAANFANAAAAISVTRIGTAPAMAYRKEIDDMLSGAGRRPR